MQRELFYSTAEYCFIQRFEDGDHAFQILNHIRKIVQTKQPVLADKKFCQRVATMFSCSPAFVNDVIDVAVEFGLIGVIPFET